MFARNRAAMTLTLPSDHEIVLTRTGMETGATETLDRLAALLAQMV